MADQKAPIVRLVYGERRDNDPLYEDQYLLLSADDIEMEMKNYWILRKVNEHPLKYWKEKDRRSKKIMVFLIMANAILYLYVICAAAWKFLI